MDALKLPSCVTENYHRMLSNGSLSEREQALFTDIRLAKFWKRASDYLSKVEYKRREDAASMLVGSFLTPLMLHGPTGTAEQPSKKTIIRDRQKKADVLIDKAAEIAGELADTLVQLEGTTNLWPDSIRLMAIVRSLIHDDKVHEIPSYFDGVKTSDALYLLEKTFRDYPTASHIFDGVPGMESQKSSWRDWLREAYVNIGHLLHCDPGNLVIREADWLVLVHALIDEAVSRNSVQRALAGLVNSTTSD